MRPFGALLSKEDALAKLLDAARPLAREEDLPLVEARGRACAEEVAATFDVPPFARATMDGYAVRAADANAPRRVVGEAFAGQAPGRIGAGEAMRIATGAAVPDGADAVVRVEDAREEGGHMHLHMTEIAGGDPGHMHLHRTGSSPRPGLNIDPPGADLSRGSLVVARGEPLTPARLGLLASVGRASVRAFAAARVAVAPTGDELLRPGEAPRAGAIYDSNSTTLRALLEGAGARVTTAAPLGDEAKRLREALMELAREHDLVVVTGGASVGARDLVVDALDEVLFHGVRVKPGKPLLVGRLAGTLVIGLPGNPTSALSNAALFVLPAVRRLMGLPPEAPRVTEATLTADVRGERERYLFLPVRLDGGRAEPVFRGSGALTSLARSDGWIGVPEGASLAAGARVVVALW